MVAGDCPTVVILVQPTYLDLHSHRDLGSNRPNNMHTVEENIWHLVFTTSTLAPVRNGKTRVASKTSKTTTAWWLVSNWSRMPLAMKRQINNEKNLIFPNSNLDRLGKTGTTSELHFSAMHKLCWRPFWTMVAGDCPTVVILVQPYLLQKSGLKWAK